MGFRKCPKRPTVLEAKDYTDEIASGQDLYSIGMYETASKGSKCSYFAATTLTLYNGIASTYCGKLSFASTELSESSLAIVLPKNSPYTEEISNATITLREQHAFRTGFEYVDSLGPKCKPFRSKAIPLSTMKYIFIALGVLGVLSIFITTVSSVLFHKNNLEEGHCCNIL